MQCSTQFLDRQDADCRHQLFVSNNRHQADGNRYQPFVLTSSKAAIISAAFRALVEQIQLYDPITNKSQLETRFNAAMVSIALPLLLVYVNNIICLLILMPLSSQIYNLIER